jgi:GntR family transcriptional regulator
VFTGEGPIFQQLADQIADDIVSGTYPEETAVPSATDFAVFHQINPATASKGVNLLVDLGALYKRRGVGMFVATGAREILLRKRRDEFRDRFVLPLAREAQVLGLTTDELHQMIDDQGQDPR